MGECDKKPPNQSNRDGGYLIWARIMSIFSFPTHTRAHFARRITKDYKMFSMWLQNKDKNWNTERIMQFFKIAAYVQAANCMAWCIMQLVYFALYKWLAVCVCGCGLSSCFMRSWIVWALSAWERERVWRSCVFVGVDVKYIIHYRRMCKFICLL